MAAADLAPMVISMFVGGTLTDRTSHRQLAAISDLLSGATVAAIPALYLTFGLTIEVLIALVFLGAIFDGPGMNARAVMIPRLADRAGMSLERVNSGFSVGQSLTSLMGAPIAGLLIALLGAARALWLTASTFAISAAIVRLLLPPTARPEPAGALDGVGLPVLSFGRVASTIAAMDEITIHGTDIPELDAQLSELLYAFNRAATGIDDGKMLNARIDDNEGNLVAAISGFTWGGTCEIEYLWVTATSRGQGIGTTLLRAAEQEARARRCHQIVLSTHSFQVPRFYETHGYQRLAAITNYPRGHEKIIYIKHLDETG